MVFFQHKETEISSEALFFEELGESEKDAELNFLQISTKKLPLKSKLTNKVETFKLEATPRTPFVNFDANLGVFEMKGKSIPENSSVFYKGMFDWLAVYLEQPAAKTTLNIQMDYFNTSSSKSVVDLFKKLESIQKLGKGEVVINWMHNEEDEDMQEAGEDYKSIIKVPFNIISFH